MTTPPFSSSQVHGQQIDTGPLSWVIGEIRDSLNRSRTALQEAITQDEETRSTTLRHAKSYLHQTHGALQIVDVDGLAILTETVEDIFDRVDNRELAFSAGTAHAIGQAYQALIEYLEELLSGEPHQPVRLFPYYRALLEVRGAERIHPADLFFPNLTARPSLPPTPVNPAVDYGRMRSRYERALLPFLKSTQTEIESANAARMREVIARIELAQSSPQVRCFWWVMHGFAEAVADGQIEKEVYVKQLFARINLQIRRLAEGSSSVAERLLRDALFFIAKIGIPSPRLRQIREAFSVDGLVPVDYDVRRYGQVDVDALAAAKERLLAAKGIWNRIAAGDANAAESFEHEMHLLADAGVRLNSPLLAQLLRELKGIARHAAHSRPGDLLGLEMATSLLFVENALSNITRLGDDFNERSEVMIARLLAVVDGEQPAVSAQWLHDMSREAQHRQTMVAVSAEMQASLRQVEKLLDEYFRDSSQPTALGQLDETLYQIEGALAILDQDDATRAIREIRKAVQHFSDPSEGQATDEQQFQKVAQNIGALSFFIESLQINPYAARSRFAFDEERGVFQARPLDGTAPSRMNPSSGRGQPGPKMSFAAAEVDLGMATVEDELQERQRQSAELATSLTVEPDNPALQERLKENLQQIRQDANLLDDPEVSDRAQAGIEIVERPDFALSQQDLAAIVTATVPLQQPVQILPPVTAPQTDEAIDAELLEIFLAEAEEVLATVQQTLPDSRSLPHSKEHLTTLRRSFHTLKGSGRMVGLVAFGEAAWAIEQVLNLRLAEGRSGDADLYALLQHGADLLGGWVQDLKSTGRSSLTPHALTEAAERVKAGGAFRLDPPGAASPTEEETAQGLPYSPVALTNDSSNEAGVGHLPYLDGNTGLDESLQISLAGEDVLGADALPEHIAVAPDASEESVVMPVANVIDFPALAMPVPSIDDNVKCIGDLEISVPLFNIYLAETDDLVRLLAQDFSEWRHEPERPVNVQAVNAAHSLAGSSATVGLNSLHELAHALEMVLHLVMRRPVPLMQYEFDTLQQTVERLKLMLQRFALGEMPKYNIEYARLLQSMRQAIELRLSQGMLSQTVERTPIPEELEQKTAGILEAQEKATLPDSPTLVLESSSPVAASDRAVASHGGTAADKMQVPADELDSDLLPIFFEEGRDILPQIGSDLRSWQKNPPDRMIPQSLLRQLHTLKGSSRMAGAMALGQHLHDMEARVEAQMHLSSTAAVALDDLLARYDKAVQMFDQLQNPQAGMAANVALLADVTGSPAAPSAPSSTAHAAVVALAPLIPVAGGRNDAAADALPVVPAKFAPPVTPAPNTLVRVRADVLDRLVNQAGEVSISRSKLENEVGSLRQSLGELTDNVSRLRAQLREIEMQAETQIASQMAQSADREFDPLEFDRFTRLQELTRMMAESVNDVSSVHTSLSRTLDNAAGDLNTQARLTRDLQQDLMRVRMVQFASISERLYRVSRQAAKEVDKRVNLDIRGGAVEIDRGVLESMTGPFEHLLRNAIVHGIETRENRKAAGKSEIGELLIEIRQEGNEVAIRFSDDGQGLNLARIKEKATRVGLLSTDTELSDRELGDLIFHPGFSTAEQVTQLAGRGVGMDVVRSEAAALGGRVETLSEPGKGTQFTIHLPVTLAVIQVVLVMTGGTTYAVPSVLVEQVQQLKTAQLTAAYNDGAVVWQGQRVSIHYLSTLLGDLTSTPVAQKYSPLMFIKSGTERVALHVDDIIGNREVVVKNIGPQLARMIGVAGATVLGSGEIVLIMNPVPLAQRAAQEDLRAPRILPSNVPKNMGAVAEFAKSKSAASDAELVQGLRTQSIVMVVDDSLTVRRVTQRLLMREGYQVVLAKDGVDALERLQSITPDVMLVDIEMPRMDGFDLTRNVRDDERTRDIPIIMITSRTAAKHRNYAKELGVNEYLGKPYQEERLLALIQEYISKAAITNHEMHERLLN